MHLLYDSLVIFLKAIASDTRDCNEAPRLASFPGLSHCIQYTEKKKNEAPRLALFWGFPPLHSVYWEEQKNKKQKQKKKKTRGRPGKEVTPRQWSLLGSRKVINSTIVYNKHANSYLTRQYSLNFFQACNNFENNGTCVTQCPPAEVYDPNLFRTVPNPNTRLAAGDLCVLQCPGEQHDWIACTKGSLWALLSSSISLSVFPPSSYFPLCSFFFFWLEGLFELSGNCLLRCPENYFSREGQCIPCDGPCPTGRTPVVTVLW